MANSVLSTFMQTKESLGASMDENVKRMFDKEKSKYKYRLCFLRSFVSRYIIIINQTSKKVFSNIDNWIINSVSLQSDARKKVINKLKSLLKEKKLINEEKDINHIELDTFEALEELKQKEKNNENKIYERLNVDYLINDDFVNIVIKEEKDPEENKKKRKDDKIVQKNYKIIVPNENRDLFEKFRKIKISDKFSQIDFAFNIYKFHDLYNSLKIFEVKPNAMNQEVFYENFVKKYIFSREHPFNDFDDIEDNNIQNNDNLQKNYFKSNRVVFQKTNKDHSPNSSKFPTICKALKSLTSKNIKKLFSLFQFTHPSNEEQKIENEEYDKYIDTSKIFTMLALIGAEVLTENIEKELMRNLKFKLVKNKFLAKHEFIRYKFWFENNFSFIDFCINSKKNSVTLSKTPRKVTRQKTKNFTNSPFKAERKNKEDEQKNFSIKDLLYNIWVDEKENMFNFKEFLDVLRVSNYSTKSEINEEVYFDIIFGE
jgi:hypothetical protein